MNVPFPNIGVVVLIFGYFFKYPQYLSKTLSVFQFQRANSRCLTGIEVCYIMKGVLGIMKVSFLAIARVVLIIWYFFQILLISFKVL